MDIDPRLAECEAVAARVEEHGVVWRRPRIGGLARALRRLGARVEAGESTDDVAAEVFALAGQAYLRCGGERPTRAQFTAGVGLHRGLIVAMEHGEDHQVPVVLAAVLSSLAGRGVHVMGATAHLAAERAARARGVCALLGLQVGVLDHELPGPAGRLVPNHAEHHRLITRAGFDLPDRSGRSPAFPVANDPAPAGR